MIYGGKTNAYPCLAFMQLNSEGSIGVCEAALTSTLVSLFFKYGFRTRAHAHFDRMNIEIAGFSPDPSNIGYGSRLHGAWYRTTVAHNTVVVDGTNQSTFTEGECLTFEPSGLVRAAANDAYPGVRFERELRLEGATLQDRFTCTSVDSHTYDWLFHAPGELCCPDLREENWVIADLGYNEAGYDLLQKVELLKGPDGEEAPKKLTLQWRRGKHTLMLRPCLPADGTCRLYRFLGHGNPPTDMWPGVLLRVEGKEAVFTVTFQFQMP